MNQIQTFIERLRSNADSVTFAEVIDLIDTYYHHTPTAFSNESAINQAGENQGSAKVLSFARLHGLTEQETTTVLLGIGVRCVQTPMARIIKTFGNSCNMGGMVSNSLRPA